MSSVAKWARTQLARTCKKTAGGDIREALENEVVGLGGKNDAVAVFWRDGLPRGG
ncbi:MULTISPECIES: hypothetical protein [unclassified Mesorhizobium]|uniref:hypothetical protein n=1 Tax=unclassified Mesorhizobium TaxID=325217 RepID=UPI0012EC6E75|nr:MULTISPECIES: hypothetical protein [unclassified Mesorhizobium]WJI81049.1 hypothetical protein NLY34_30700 [Mesorhizobium sp. C374B]WJI87590.1 hypothetical protein NLY42_01435 [Mesorhizobium sp. C372A]